MTTEIQKETHTQNGGKPHESTLISNAKQIGRTVTCGVTWVVYLSCSGAAQMCKIEASEIVPYRACDCTGTFEYALE